MSHYTRIPIESLSRIKVAVGVAESRTTGVKVMFQVWRGTAETTGWTRNDVYRVFPVPCDLRHFDLGPEEFRGRYKTLAQEKVKEPHQ